MTEVSKPLWEGEKSRKLVKRIVVEGRLIMQTPAHFGSGDEAGSLLPLIFDEISGKPLLTGTSIAGALRSYLWTLEQGYGKKQETNSLATRLFGGVREDDDGLQSNLIVDDAYGENTEVELRDGVKIDGQSRTAQKDKLYSIMVWSAGATFNLRFELLISEGQDEADMRQALANALNGLQKGEITLGARKTRGFGRVTVDPWQVREFDLKIPAGLVAWVKEGGQNLTLEVGKSNQGQDIFSLLTTSNLEDQRERLIIQARFALEGSLLIRADSAVADMAHLSSNGKPVLSGTSLAGVIRSRTLKIARTLNLPHYQNLIDEMFGAFGDNNVEKRTSSRVTIEEQEISGGEAERWVQSRVAIDRFTGGALDTALFNQQPQFGGEVEINLELRNPEKREVGLLLLALKDLWTGDLPVGGESSVGRGRLRGESAFLKLNNEKWTISRDGKGLKIDGDTALLENFVTELTKEVTTA